MEKRRFGKTELELGILGFGAMRLPGFDTRKYDEVMDGAVQLMQAGFDGGINYVDTAAVYNEGMSEVAVGKAVKGRRDDVVISTKLLPSVLKGGADSFDKLLAASMKRLGVDYLDVFYLHGLGLHELKGHLSELGIIDRVMKRKEEGLIGHVGFSSHDKPERVVEMVETGLFECMLAQYNFIDESYGEAIHAAHAADMGVALMGPVGGGRLSGMGPEFNRLIPEGMGRAPELALRFVWSNPGVTVALSGMDRTGVLEENLALADSFEPLGDAEQENLKLLQEKFEAIRSIYCTGCGYCMPCEQGVRIPDVFYALICDKVLGSPAYARLRYNFFLRNNRADKCIECGECMDKCPQKIDIIEQLKETHKLLAG